MSDCCVNAILEHKFNFMKSYDCLFPFLRNIKLFKLQLCIVEMFCVLGQLYGPIYYIIDFYVNNYKNCTDDSDRHGMSIKFFFNNIFFYNDNTFE